MSNQAAIFAKRILQQAFHMNASDIHFHPLPTNKEVAIFFRILGKRKPIRNVSKQFYQMMLTFFKFTSHMDIGETRRPQNGMIEWENEKNNTFFDLRLSTLPVNDSESLTIRIFPQHSELHLNELFLFPFQLSKIKQ